MRFYIILAILLAGIAWTVWSSINGWMNRKSAVSVVGSTSVQPFAEMLAQKFQELPPHYNVEVQGGGSTFGVASVTQGIADIGTCSRALSAEELAGGLKPITIARDGLAIVVYPGNSVNGLTSEQIRDMFAGKITNWKQAGGLDQKIHLITREEGSGTREAFTKMIMEKKYKVPAGAPAAEERDTLIANSAITQESNGAVKELVRTDPGAIGYMSLGLVKGELKMLMVDGVPPTAEAVHSGQYALVRPFLFVLKGTPNETVQKYIDFVLSPAGQDMLEAQGLVRAPRAADVSAASGPATTTAPRIEGQVK